MARDEGDNVGVDFVKCELEAALRWAQLSQLEEKMGEPEACQRAKLQAEIAYASFLRFRPRVEVHFTQLERSVLDGLQKELAKTMPGLVTDPL